jgi:hypothetical protein
VNALLVGPDEEILRPGGIIELCGIGGAGDVSLAAAAELDLRARAAIGTWDEKHKATF